MKLFSIFCVIIFAWGSTADSFNDLSAIEQLVSNEIGHENYALAEIILRIIEQFRGVINDAVKELLESQRHLILTGIPPTIPPLDPFYIEEYLIEPEEPLTGFSNFSMRLNDSHLKGLYDLKIEQVDIRPLGLFGMISISVDKLEMEGFHSTRATLLSQVFNPIEGNGPFTMTLNNFRASVFIQIEFIDRIRPNLKTVITAYSISSAETNFTGFGIPVVERAFNAAVSLAFPAIVALTNIETNLWLNNEFIPAVNGVINDLTIIDIIGLIRNIIRNNADSFDSEIMEALYRFDQINNNL